MSSLNRRRFFNHSAKTGLAVVAAGSFLAANPSQSSSAESEKAAVPKVGAYVDTLHMAKEGGLDGWRQGLDILFPWIALCAVKNFAWERSHRDKQGQQRWKTINVPIADGVCPLPDFVAALKKLNYHGPYSMHSEYKGSHSFKNLDTAGCIRQTALDLKYFRTLL